MKNHTTQSQIVILPYVSAVNPSDSQFIQMIQSQDQKLLNRMKDALDEAGVAWIDPRTKERSKPADSDARQLSPMAQVGNTDSVEGCDNAQ